MYFDPSKHKTNGLATPPTFWTTSELSIGLLAACLPPLNPLIRRVSFPRKIYDSLRLGLASRSSDRSKPSERLPSVENIPKFFESNEGKTEWAKGAEIEMERIW